MKYIHAVFNQCILMKGYFRTGQLNWRKSWFEWLSWCCILQVAEESSMVWWLCRQNNYVGCLHLIKGNANLFSFTCVEKYLFNNLNNSLQTLRNEEINKSHSSKWSYKLKIRSSNEYSGRDFQIGTTRIYNRAERSAFLSFSTNQY